MLARSNPCLSPSFCPGGQDFYSHSNWVELGKQQPHPHLLWPRLELWSLAQGKVVTLCGGGAQAAPLLSVAVTLCESEAQAAPLLSAPITVTFWGLVGCDVALSLQGQ